MEWAHLQWSSIPSVGGWVSHVFVCHHGGCHGVLGGHADDENDENDEDCEDDVNDETGEGDANTQAHGGKITVNLEPGNLCGYSLNSS